MKPKQEGPFPITEVLGPVTDQLQLPATWWIHNVFHAALLRPYKKNEVYGENYTEPPQELVEGEEVYEVETILNHIEGEDEDTSISLNGRDTLSPMHHGNRNTCFLMMATYCDNTNVAITSDTHWFTRW